MREEEEERGRLPDEGRRALPVWNSTHNSITIVIHLGYEDIGVGK